MTKTSDKPARPTFDDSPAHVGEAPIYGHPIPKSNKSESAKPIVDPAKPSDKEFIDPDVVINGNPED